MNTLKLTYVVSAFFILSATSCQSGSEVKEPENKDTTTVAATTPAAPAPLVEKVLTREERDALTPDMVIQMLKDGNQRFVSNDLTQRSHSSQVRAAAGGQFPKAVVISCLDSRVPVEDVFDRGIGDVFVGRVAGNFVNVDLLGSLEFGCKVAGAKLILVMGHEACGAVKATIDNVKLGNITEMLTKIRPAVVKSADFKGDKSTGNEEYVDYVAKNNVLNTIETIKQKSPILKEMADKGEIKIVGAYYSLKTGQVTFL